MRALKVLMKPEALHELRVPGPRNKPAIASGYFNSPEAMAEAAFKLNQQGHNTYLTINPVCPDILARVEPNKIVFRPDMTTEDNEIASRHWLFLDVDVKQNVRHIAATAAQHKAAYDCAQKIRQWLMEDINWPAPVMVDSGNGYYPLFRIAEPNDEATKLLLERVLKAIASKFDGDGIKIDPVVFNASRIARIPGTVNRKGKNTQERPHRVARLIDEVYTGIEIVTREQLEQVARLAPTKSHSANEPTSSASPELPEVLKALEQRGITAKPDGTKHILSECPFDPSHNGGTSVAIFANGEFSCYRCEDKHWGNVLKLFGIAKRANGVDSSESSKTAPAPTPSRVSVTDEVPEVEHPSKFNWPAPLDEKAFHGLAGAVVRLIEPHSEADPAALLIQFLTGFGNLVGRHAYFTTDGARQFANLFCVIVGRTSKGRKGTSWNQARRILGLVDEEWNRDCVKSGLASGEGVIWSVRDAIHERSPIKEKGRIVGYEDAECDPGIGDKRLCIFEAEFARALKVAARETNTLSDILRDSFDTGDLNILTKKQAARATGAHISLIAHVTAHELRKLLSVTESANGYANRHLFVCARRSKLLPDGGRLDSVDFSQIIERLQAAAQYARTVGEMHRNEEARAIWHAVYESLSEGRPGMFGSITSRADCLVVRLSMIYALLDHSDVTKASHLNAALEVWRYCEDSARFIFGDALGDETADEILRELRGCSDGMTRTDLRDHFQRNRSAEELGRALGVLQEYGLARVERQRDQEDQRRPTERWYAITVQPVIEIRH